MSTLLEQASLVMIPSGYKEDIVYSQIPTNGNGDLTFTRASNGTRINSAGLVEVVPWNLLQYSEQFDNAVWGKDLSSITYNQPDPFGGNNAALCTFTNLGTSRIFQNYSIVAGNTYTLSAWIKGVNITDFRFLLGTNQVVFVTSQIVNGEWIRVSATVTATTTGTYQQSPARSNNTNGESFYIYGAQLVEGATAKPYFPTTDRLNVPRLTYQNGGGGCPSLLLEKQSTNYATNSEDFTQWGPSAGTITLNAGTSPDGTNNANLFTEDTTTGYHRFSNSCTGLTGTAKTFSIYAKWAGGTGREWLTIDNGPMAFFDLKNGVVGSVQGTGTSSMEAMGNGWYRCIYTNLNSTGATMYVGTANANNGAGNHLGNGQPAYYCWGAQAE